MPLTDAACKNAKPSEKPRKLTDGGGLYLEVSPAGGRYWRLKYRFGGKEKRLALGVYPMVSLSEARDASNEAKKLLAQSIDPSSVKKARKLQAVLDTRNTFELMARDWHEHKKAGINEKTAATLLQRLESDVFPVIGKYPMKDLTTPRIVSMVKAIDNRGAHEVARRMWQTCGQIFQYAIQNGTVQTSPVVGDLRHVLKPVPRGHYASFEINEIPDFLSKLRSNEGNLFIQTKLAVELMMLTFVRTKELIQAEWSEFDFESKIWTIPASRMKMRKVHLVPLCRQSIKILEELKKLNGHRSYVFPSRSDPRKCMSDNTILMALDRMGYRGKMTGHGFRSLAMSTIMERLNYRYEVPDRQLAHRHGNDVRVAYDRTKFLDERITMMQDWANYLDRVAKENNIINIDFRAA